MLLAQLGLTCEFRRLMRDCLRFVQLGGFSVLFTFEITLSKKDWLGAIVPLILDLLPIGDKRLWLSAKPILSVFLTLVSVFYSFSISILSAKVKSSSPSFF